MLPCLPLATIGTLLGQLPAAYDMAMHGKPVPLTAASLGLGSATSTTRDQLIDWTRGIDVQDEDADGDRTEMHRFMGDPLHARPALVTYGGTPAAPDAEDAVVFVPTNDGFLHAVNARTGVELWSFIPPEQQQRLPDL